MGFESEPPQGFKDFMSLINTFNSEYLYSLFCDKENVKTDISVIEGSNIDENKKKLLEAFGLEIERLFESFYNFYGDFDVHKENLTEYLKSRFDCKKTYGDMGSLYDFVMDADKILHKKLFKIIFDTVGKDDIVRVISGQKLEVDKVLSRVSIMIKYYFDVRNDKISDFLRKCIQDSPYFLQLMNNPNGNVEDYINQFINYYEEDTLNYIIQGLKKSSKFSENYGFVNLDSEFCRFDEFLSSIDIFLLKKFSSYLVFKGFLGFCSEKIGNNGELEKIGNNGELEKIGNDGESQKIGNNGESQKIGNNGESHTAPYVYGNVYGFFDEIFPDSKRENILGGLNFVKITKDSFAKSFEVLSRILKKLKIRDNGIYNAPFNTLDIVKIEKAEQLFQENKGRIFPQLKEYFFNEVLKFLFNGEDFQLSLDLDGIVSDLRKKYEYAKPHIGDVSKKQRDEMEKTFLKKEKDKYRIRFLNAFLKYSDFFNDLELKEFFAIIELFMSLLSVTKIIDEEKLNEDYKEFIKKILEEKFKKSHNNAKPKLPVVPVVKTLNNDEPCALKPSPKNIVIFRKELPEGLVSDLEKYFGGKLDPKLARSLKNSFGVCKIPGYIGVYKTSWYTKEKYGFDFDDEFFEILKRHKFFCLVEEHLDEGSVDNGDFRPTEQGPATEFVEVEDLNNEDKNKLIDILGNLDRLETDEEKVDCYIKAFELFYDIQDRDYIKSQILNGIEHDGRISKGIESIFYKILNGKRELIRKLDKSRKRYYRFDVGYNTGYRVVINDQEGKSRRIIIDFVDHGIYERRISGYYCKY